jgi:hypothetical protein
MRDAPWEYRAAFFSPPVYRNIEAPRGWLAGP